MDDDMPMDEDEFSPAPFGSGEMISSTSTTDGGGGSSIANSLEESSVDDNMGDAAAAGVLDEALQPATTFEPDGKLAMERIGTLYPQLDLAKFPLPREWSTVDRYQLLTLSKDNLRVGYTALGDGKSHKDAAAIRADNPIPRVLGIYYFEIFVVHQGLNGYVGIGLCEKSVNLNRLPGWDKCSYGYHGDDGNFFSSSGNGTQYGPQFTTEDTIGCGINFVNREIFFTKNGETLGTALDCLNISGDLYPTIGLQTKEVLIDTNFGQKPFKYDIAKDIQQLQKTTLRQVMNVNLSRKKNEWMNKAVASWFVQRGYVKSYEAIAKIIGGQVPPAEKELMEKRKEYRKQMQNGQVEQTVADIEKVFPDLLKRNKQLDLMLKTQQFVEVFRKRSRSRSRQRGSSVTNGSTPPASSSRKRPASDTASHSGKRRTRANGASWEQKDLPCSSSNGNSTMLEEEIKNGQSISNGNSVQNVEEDGSASGSKPIEREVSVDAMTTTVVAEADDIDSENGVSDGVVDGLVNGYTQSQMAPYEKFGDVIEFAQTVQEMANSFSVPRSQKQLVTEAFSLLGCQPNEVRDERLLSMAHRSEVSEMLNYGILSHCGKRTTSILTNHLQAAKRYEKNVQDHNIGGVAFTNVEDFMVTGFDRDLLNDDDPDEKKVDVDTGGPIKFADET
ncbi:hypothetical protein L596_008581 [Steinernema carpocapsae]|uniref:B30.2/SPRY domain-containing protein n=1 Tax=Steinernema carpocapsae TaxID=34508 RepID=A0A4U5PD30_STECR|nr:hypothetical protein L596_008581 [Steinernema carpocapsae]